MHAFSLLGTPLYFSSLRSVSIDFFHGESIAHNIAENWSCAMGSLIDILFGCPHHRTSFPITLKTANHVTADGKAGTYIVCLDCGKEFAYDWREMKIVRSPGQQPQAAISTVPHAA